MTPEHKQPSRPTEHKQLYEQTDRSAEHEAKQRLIERMLSSLHEREADLIGEGAYFDVYQVKHDHEEEPGELKGNEFVWKDFRSGDTRGTFNHDQQATVFAHQFLEYQKLKEALGAEYFPKAAWIVDADANIDPNYTLNSFSEWAKVQVDRYVAGRMGTDDPYKQAWISDVMQHVREQCPALVKDRTFVGGIAQERVNGVTFDQLLQNLEAYRSMPNYETARQQILTLIARLDAYHRAGDYNAFALGDLTSDNVKVEVDDMGQLTGRVLVLDTNFSERPTKFMKKIADNDFNKKVQAPLIAALG